MPDDATVDRAPMDRATVATSAVEPVAATAAESGQAVPRAVPGRVRRRWWRRRWARIAIGVIGVIGGYYLVTVYQVWSTGRSDQARPVDAIVVMGAAQYDGRPSPQLAARLDHVVTLWGQGLADTVVVTGGNQPGDRFTEAEASIRYLTERGVPADAFVSEDVSHNSYDSLRAVASILAERGQRRVLLVSDPFHLLRIRLIAEELGLTAYVSPTPTTTVTGGTAVKRELKEAAGIALGRLIGFRRLTNLTG